MISKTPDALQGTLDSLVRITTHRGTEALISSSVVLCASVALCAVLVSRTESSHKRRPRSTLRSKPIAPARTGSVSAFPRAFKMKMHAETREMAMYSLVFARDDKRLGPNLTPSSIDGTARSRAAQPPAAPPIPAPPSTAPGAQPPLPECSISLGMTPTASFLRGGAIAFSEIVRLIATNLGRPVVDKTRLTGAFDIQMRFHSVASGLPGLPVRPPGASATPDDSVPSLMTQSRSSCAEARVGPGGGAGSSR